MHDQDLFDGIFDDRGAQQLVIMRDGRRGRYAQKNCCGNPHSPWPELRQPWGTYPDLPAQATQAQGEPA